MNASPCRRLRKEPRFEAARADLEWIFTLQTERVVGKDNTVAIGDQSWQLEKCRFRSSLAGCTVSFHEHLDGTVSIRYGPHGAGPIYRRKGTCWQTTKRWKSGGR